MKLSSALYLVIAGLLLVLAPACRKKKPLVTPSPKPMIWTSLFKNKLFPPKKRVMIFSSSGGGGHTAAANALREYLKNDYEVEIVNVFEEVLHPLDPIHAITDGTYNGEDLYNFLLQSNIRWCANNMISLGKITTNFQANQIQYMLEEFLIANEKPDVLISVIPVLNGTILAVAEKLNIPFAVIALDRDMATIGFLNGIWNPTYKKFIFGIPFDEESLKKTVEDYTGINPQQIRAIGVPVRTSFLEKKSRKVLRKQLQVPDNKPVVTVLMGSVGSGATLRYARALARVTCPLHIFLCLGKNEQLRQLIEKTIKFPEHITVSIVGFTDRIADYMTVSNMLITKSGSVSFFEAMVSQVPIFFDETRPVLKWEYMNIDFVKEHEFGDSIILTRKIAKTVDAYFKDPSWEQQIRANIAHYKLPDVRKNVGILLKDLLAMQDDQEQMQ